MSNDPNNVNPYAVPESAPQVAYQTSTEQAKLIKDFRSQSLALAVLWILFGSLGVIGAVILVGNVVPNFRQDAPMFVGTIAGATGIGWIIAGIATLLKQTWGLYLGIALCYLSVLGNLLRLNICALVILAVILLQAHRVLRFASRMRQEGIPLTAKV